MESRYDVGGGEAGIGILVGEFHCNPIDLAALFDHSVK